MSKLYASLFGLVVLFAAAMSFATLSVRADQWWWGVVAAGLLLVFAALGGVLVPGTLRSLSGGRLRAAKAALQLFGSLCGLLFFIMAITTWALGKRSIGASSGYTTLGLLIFLGLAGVGIQGFLAMVGYFVYVRNQAIVVPTRLEHLREGTASGHGTPGAPIGATSAHAAEVPMH